ncbi:hypothetical protein QYG89_09935 [Bacillus sp. B190/17]|uniref:Preprotein translocase subunit Tim44 n=1 Tax=Bacillus lumedeiriae TaxID=3058829 RepID=A0ABW8IBE4_9BACI
MLKKIIASLLVCGLFFAPIGNLVDQNPHVASAKSYKSGKKSFNSTKSNSPSLFKKDNDKQKSTTNYSKKSTAAKSNKGGLLKGLFIGGLAGMLLGGLIGNLGILGSILGFIINMMAIVALVMIIRAIFTALKRKRREENTWER